MIEVCGGSMRLTAAFRKLGRAAIGIDWAGNRHKPQAPWLKLDLTTDGGRDALRQLVLAQPRPEVVWFGLPCGTASRAREIPGPNLPRPLRSDAEPWGRTDVELTVDEADKLARANAIYRFAAELIRECHALGIKWAVENPLNSHLWSLPEFASLLQLESVRDQCYQACEFGSQRDKKQRIRTSAAELDFLDGRWCSGQHKHAPWRTHNRLHTSEEAEYPLEFCKQIAESFVAAWGPPKHKGPAHAASLSSAAAAAAVQPSPVQFQ